MWLAPSTVEASAVEDAEVELAAELLVDTEEEDATETEWGTLGNSQKALGMKIGPGKPVVGQPLCLPTYAPHTFSLLVVQAATLHE